MTINNNNNNNNYLPPNTNITLINNNNTNSSNSSSCNNPTLSINSNNTTSSNSNINTTRTGSGSTNTASPACAACKYQRRKCAPDCILAPYFPHDRQRQFLNAHKLFGVRKITKMIENLSSQSHKDDAMRSIIFQSDVRATDPVGGCYRIVLHLRRQLDYAQAELQLLLHHLAVCRAQHQQQHPDPSAAVESSTNNNNNAVESAMMGVGCLDVYGGGDPLLLGFQYQPQHSDNNDMHQHQQQQFHQQHHHHHHHHHHHQNQHQHQHHGYVVEEALLQDGESVNSWGMAAGA